MYSEGIWALIKEVVSSWQVIAVTVALVLYLNIVFYVSRAYHAPRMKLKGPKKKKKSGQESVLQGPEEALPTGNTNDELGLEES